MHVVIILQLLWDYLQQIYLINGVLWSQQHTLLTAWTDLLLQTPLELERFTYILLITILSITVLLLLRLWRLQANHRKFYETQLAKLAAKQETAQQETVQQEAVQQEAVQQEAVQQEAVQQELVEETTQQSTMQEVLVQEVVMREEVAQQETDELTQHEHIADLDTGFSSKQDIAMQKLIDLASINDQEFMESVMKAVSIPLYIVDREYRFLHVNDAFCDIFGAPASELLGKTIYETMDRERAVVYSNTIDVIFSMNQLHEREETYIDRDDKRYDLITRSVPTTLRNGQHILVSTGIDVTALKKLKRELRDSAEFLNSVINSVPDPLIVEDHQYRFIRVNEAFCRFTGRKANELIGRSSYDLLPTADVEILRSQDERLLREGDSFEREWSFVNHARQQRHVLIKRAGHRLPSGQRIFTSQLLDITNQKDVEARLLEAKEAAESANRAKSSFLSTMTHELRTPMNGVLGITSLLLDTPLNHEQQSLIDTIRTSGDALLTVINQILDFSKIEAEKLELEETKFDLRKMIEESFDLVAPQATDKSLLLAYFFEGNVPMTWVQDVGRLRQIITNLISNAVKFTEFGEITVTLSAQPLDAELFGADMYRLHFAVRDTGPGIPPDRIELLFQSFNQLDASVARRFGGTGLGLVISRRLAEAMGGTMWVESKLGNGTTFYFTIIARHEYVTALEQKDQNLPLPISQAEQPAFVPRKELGTLRDKRIVVLVNHETMGRLLEQHLHAWSVDLAKLTCLDLSNSTDHQSAETIELLETADVLIVDEAIPDLLSHRERGAVNSERLQQILSLYPKLPVVLLTRLGQRINLSDYDNRLAFVTKPIHSSQLHDALVTVIYNKVVHQSHEKTMFSVDHQTPNSTGRVLRILLAEDNLVNQQVALGFLSKFGYRADIAGNGVEVLEAIKRQAYDVILMDVNMPEMDGLTATIEVRQLEISQQPYIIAMTANAMYEDRKRCAEVGMEDYVSKPIHIEELSSALQRAHAWLARQEQNMLVTPWAIEENNMTTSANGKNPITTINGASTSIITTTPLAIEDPADHDPMMESTGQSSSQSATESPVDPSVLQAMAELMGETGEEMVTELIQLYLESAPDLVANFRQGMATEDLKLIQTAAHTLRSSSGQIGAHHFADLASEIEALCDEQEFQPVASKANAFYLESERVFAYFRKQHEARQCAGEQPIAQKSYA